MKFKIFMIFLILLMPFSAFGDEKADLAKEVLELTHVNQTIRQLQDQMMSQLNIPADKKVKATEFQNKLSKKISDVMSYDKTEKEYIDLYTSVYTAEELRGIIKFYKSPVGKSMIEKQPVITKKAMEMSQKKLKVLIPDIQKMIEKFEQELKAK